jgi:hypothetical protein
MMMNNQNNANNGVNGTPIPNNLGNVTPVQNNDNIETLGNTTVIPPIPPDNNGIPEMSGIGVNPSNIGNITQPMKEDIGVIPPKKEEPPKHTGKKVLFVILIILLIAGVAVGVYYYLNLAKNKTNTSLVKTNNMTLELGEDIPTDITKYATFSSTINSTNCTLDTSKIDNKTIGNYSYTITCGTNTYNGTLAVKDTVAPTVSVQDVYKTVGETVTPDDFILSCKDATACTSKYNDEASVTNDLKTAGTYAIAIVVTDASGNNVNVTGNLIVVNGTVSAYLKCTSSYAMQSEYRGTYHSVDTLAIDSSNSYLGITKRSVIYVFLQASEYNTVKEKNLNEIKFGDYTGKFTWDDTNYSLTIDTYVDSKTLDTEFGSTFPKDYNTIKTYYEGKGYTCESVTK